MIVSAPASIRPVYGEPQSSPAQPCDEFCDPDCVHHIPAVGWDLSFGSRINFHPATTDDERDEAQGMADRLAEAIGQITLIESRPRVHAECKSCVCEPPTI